MSREPIEFLSAVLLVSQDPKRLADCYRDVVGVPLRRRGGQARVHGVRRPGARAPARGARGAARLSAARHGLLLVDRHPRPDGNLIEFTELCDEWVTQLEARRAEGADVLSRWRAAKSRRR